MAHCQDVLRTDTNGTNTSNTINRAELVGVLVQAWLKQACLRKPAGFPTSNYLQAAYRLYR